jgi:hypothetical protein
MWLSYKLQVFAWLVIYQEIPPKAKLAKRKLSNGLPPESSMPQTKDSEAYFLGVFVFQAMLEVP